MRQVSVKWLNPGACVLGIRMPAGAELAIDIAESQVADLQAAIDAGDVSADGMAPAPVVVEKPKSAADLPKAKAK